MNGTGLSLSKTRSRVMKDRLLLEAQRLGFHRDAEDALLAALEAYVRLRKQQNILCVYGNFEDQGDGREEGNEERQRKCT